MNNVFIKLKFRKILFIELILFSLLIIGSAACEAISSMQDILIIIIMYVIPVAWIICELYKLDSSIKILFKPIEYNKSKVFVTVSMIFMLSYCLFLSMQFLGIIFNSTVVYNMKEFRIIHVITSVIFAPIAEEVFFRGYLLNKFMAKGTIRRAVILSSVLFAILHYVGCINAFIIGICLALIYAKYRNIILTMIVHALYNGMLLLFKFLFYINVFTISIQIAPLLLLITMSLIIVSIIWLIHFVRSNYYIFEINKDI